MQVDADRAERERLLAILDFWHKIEFFIPYDLSSRLVSGDGRTVFWLHAKTLLQDGAALSRPVIPEEKQITGFTLFLGVFSKSEIADIRTHFEGVAADMAEYEDAERGDLDGDSCFASLQLTPLGQPMFETFSVSTLPWALGRVRKSGLASLSHEAFAASKRQLSELLQNFQAQRQLTSSSFEAGADQPIDAAEILTLNELLCDWAGFVSREEKPIAAVEIRYRDRVERPDLISLQPQQEDQAAHADDQEDESASVEEDIGILNSFFIEDIERAMICIKQGNVPEPLRRYLTPLADEKRIDLYSQDGRAAIVRALHPGNLNRGRWLSEPHLAMSLMQQFAINSAIGDRLETRLFSVNGPPGTGKTTLLRDMFADNIVRRARVLASLETARDAFDGLPRRVTFADHSTASISALIPALTGFEMVVASSNNAAVENISRDLPKQSAIAKSSSFRYLQTVAHKIACQKDNGGVIRLSDSDRPWGLIACALGNSRNRRAFKERFAFMEIPDRPKPGWSGAEKPQTIWEWLKSYEGATFAEASAAFHAADDVVRGKIGQYARYADLRDEIALVTQDAFCRETLEKLAAAADELRHAQNRCDEVAAEMGRIKQSLSSLKEEQQLLDRSAPARWKRVLATNPARQHRQDVAANARQQLELRKALAECEDRLAKAEKPALERALRAHDQAARALRSRRKIWIAKTEELERLGEILDHPAAPDRLADLDSEQVQIDGFWHQDELAALRSALFEAALTLHEAWLAEVGRKGGGFGGNIVAISKLLSNNNPVDDKHVASIWQSLFMIVPVVSTTFASFARQFRGLEAGSIGWVFIDEAGQAVPQAAVGALLRARRAMVIGDPQQIEPVFTLPSVLIGAASALSLHTAAGQYSPNRVSVQMLADAANRYGTTLQDEEADGLWIGSPLRVHRRCIDPMFSLANQIAYQNKMIFGLAERRPAGDAPPFYGDSAWIDVKGKVSGKQAVAEQTDFMVDLLTASYRRSGALPDLYVISPFKEVKNNLRRALAQARWIDQDGYTGASPPKLQKWLQERIGTVHTFQGKEEDSVFMVLGADAAHRGAAGWAASKPNLLNVALTRAKRRFYIVGDRTLWQTLPYFREAANALETVQAAEFLARNALDTRDPNPVLWD
ncbi:UvrD family helicase-like domain-containing protein [Rhizobium etli bv. mimosae str. IE4771]|uniref:UvrD family helicase-like domain-containing protein n=1 Tax=Rhizobium etli bv. mimosae str. IE4771 TaxID=1432050 RepID=A0A060I196_RHIET|nr:DEAD/DEAH box helicase [Rhizobium sp. IE4771]AIC25246.1 UvrD family helicase-like domain-containing protein [Rhizobium sp. IE4771]